MPAQPSPRINPLWFRSSPLHTLLLLSTLWVFAAFCSRGHTLLCSPAARAHARVRAIDGVVDCDTRQPLAVELRAPEHRIPLEAHAQTVCLRIPVSGG
eukprot:2292417-Rhodomonas_salina.1